MWKLKHCVYLIFYIFLVSNIRVSQSQYDYDYDFDDEIDSDNVCPQIAKWSKLVAKRLVEKIVPISTVIIHHTLGVSCFNHKICSTIVRNIQDYSMGKGKCLDIKYNFLIGDDGKVYSGTSWNHAGCRRSNKNAYDIAFIGDFTDKLPSSKAIENFKKLMKCGTTVNKNIMENYALYGAMQLDHSTKSPGQTLFNELKKFDNWQPTY